MFNLTESQKQSESTTDDLDGLIITLSVKRRKTAFEISHYKAREDGPIQSEGELLNIAKRAAGLLWDQYDIHKL